MRLGLAYIYFSLIFGFFRTGGTIKIEYGYIRRLDKDGQVLPSPSEGDESSSQFFFTRQIFVPILITVQTVLSVLNTDMLLLGGFESDAKDQESDMATPLNRILSMNEKSLSLEEMMADPFGIAAEKHSPGVSFPAGTDINAWAADKDKRNKDYCLLTFDLRNQWSNPFEICFEIYDDNGKPGAVFVEYS